MDVLLEIDTYDKKLLSDLMGNPGTFKRGMMSKVPDVMDITLDSLDIRKGFGFPETLTFALTFATSVGASIIANWLYDRLKGRVEKISIDRLEIELDEGEIKKVIYEKIRKD